jgi:PEP-CTERM/exosortase A-associated glycosyltransferase
VRYFRSCGRFLAPHVDVHDPSPVLSAIRVLQNVSLLRMTMNVAKTYRPQIIHAHSPFTCGICGEMTGWLQKIPTIYEMRGIWEDSHTSRYGLSDQSMRYRMVRMLENVALRRADKCVVISDSLRTEILQRGIRSERIAIVPNGVDVQKFTPGPACQELQRSLGVENKIIMGYVGSFFKYEGIDLLVEAMRMLMPKFPNLILLLVGDGELMPVLKKMVSEIGEPVRIIFAGRIPYDRIMDYYRLCDFLVLPRRKARETTLVTPLKPLEIMSMAKALIASDVGGHLEIVEEGVNGLLFESGNVETLVAGCSNLIESTEFRLDLGRRARVWVESNRDWNVLINRYVALYEKLSGTPGP